TKRIGWYQLYFVINSLITVGAISIAFKKTTSFPLLALIGYVLTPMFYLDSFSIVRQGSAVALTTLATVFLYKKNYYKYAILLFIAIGIHASSLIGLLMIILHKFKSDKKTVVMVTIIGSILTFFPVLDFVSSVFQEISIYTNSYVQGKMSIYLSSSTSQGRFYKLVVILPSLFLSFNFNHIKSSIGEKAAFINAIGLLIWGLFSFDHTLSLRLSSFFLIFQIIAFVELIVSSKYSIRNTNIYLIYLHTIFILIFVVNILQYNPTSEYKISFLPYQTFFNHTEYLNYNPYR
ncbi:MAG: EpsG family protein, partial [Porphyromonadaceae bacterium]|nr:EpsG family protein [Porphyromonadaceae bacterium]